MRKCIALLVAGTISVSAFAQVLDVNHAPNNGLTAAGSGLFLDLTDKTGVGLFINSFQTYASSAAGSDWTVEVWTRPGGYQGFDGDPAGWSLHETVLATSNGTTILAPLNLVNPLVVGSNDTLGVYLIAMAGGIRYTGTGANPPQTLWFNDDIEMFSDVARSAPWAGSRFSPRTFAGEIHYEPVPEPATMAVLGLGALAVAARRRLKKA